MFINELKIAKLCDQEVLQLEWEPKIGDKFFVRETKAFGNAWYNKIATVAVIRNTISRKDKNSSLSLRLGVRDKSGPMDYTFYFASQNLSVLARNGSPRTIICYKAI